MVDYVGAVNSILKNASNSYDNVNNANIKQAQLPYQMQQMQNQMQQSNNNTAASNAKAQYAEQDAADTHQTSHLKAEEAKHDVVIKTLGAAVDQPTYDMARRRLTSMGLADDHDLPEQYNQGWVQQMRNSAISSKDRLAMGDSAIKAAKEGYNYDPNTMQVTPRTQRQLPIPKPMAAKTPRGGVSAFFNTPVADTGNISIGNTAYIPKSQQEAKGLLKNEAARRGQASSFHNSYKDILSALDRMDATLLSINPQYLGQDQASVARISQGIHRIKGNGETPADTAYNKYTGDSANIVSAAMKLDHVPGMRGSVAALQNIQASKPGPQKTMEANKVLHNDWRERVYEAQLHDELMNLHTNNSPSGLADTSKVDAIYDNILNKYPLRETTQYRPINKGNLNKIKAAMADSVNNPDKYLR